MCYAMPGTVEKNRNDKIWPLISRAKIIVRETLHYSLFILQAFIEHNGLSTVQSAGDSVLTRAKKFPSLMMLTFYRAKTKKKYSYKPAHNTNSYKCY